MRVMVNDQLSNLLRQIAKQLDIPQHMYEDAVIKYTDVGEWLAEEGSALEKFDPDIYPQGSFRLGTMVRPMGADEFDIDLVCHLKIKKENTTQTELKDRVGNRLAERDDIKKILKEQRRCWLLDYPQQFHMDVLPAIPNVDALPDGICLTDTKLRNWQYSNPKEYAEWFKDQMKVILTEKRARYAKKHSMSVEEVPEYNEELKTPLQRVVQILKRHRDIRFESDKDNKPVSMILTTLAAKAYGNEADLYDALVAVATKMHHHIEKRDDGKWWVANPVDEQENFADKWNEYPERRTAFFEWLEQVRSDFVSIDAGRLITKTASAWEQPLGDSVVRNAMASLGFESNRGLITKSLEPSIPEAGDLSHCVAPTWYMNLTHKVAIKARVYPSLKGKKNWPLRKSVPKNAWLKLTASTNATGDYEILWQITNSGIEARTAEQLRGTEFEECLGGPNTRWESTAYKGTHFVEAFVVKNGVCIARSGQLKVRVW